MSPREDAVSISNSLAQDKQYFSWFQIIHIDDLWQPAITHPARAVCVSAGDIYHQAQGKRFTAKSHHNTMLLARGPIWKHHPTNAYTWIHKHTFYRDLAKQQLKLETGDDFHSEFYYSCTGPNEPTHKWPAAKMGFWFSDHILVIILTRHPNTRVALNQIQTTEVLAMNIFIPLICIAMER